ncbi:MAG: hypothetical protein ACOYI4_02170 [Christensenellales bacterium]
MSPRTFTKACAVVFALTLILALFGGTLAFAEEGIATETELRSAVASAETNSTLSITGNITLTDTLEIPQSLTLELNGHTISGSDPGSVNTVIKVVDEAALTIQSSAPGGKIRTTDLGTNPCVVWVDHGSLLLKSGTITSEGTTKTSQAVKLGANAVFTMQGGSVTTVAENSGFSMAVNILSSGAVFNMQGGSIDCAKGNAIALRLGTTLNLSGGSVSGSDARAVISGSMGAAYLNISGGTITANGSNDALGPGQNNTTTISGNAIINGSVKALNSTLTISGGTLNDTLQGSARTTITGGAFAHDPSQYISGDDTLLAAFTLGSTTQYIAGGHAALNEKAAAAQAGDTIEVLRGSANLTIDTDGILVKNSGEDAILLNERTMQPGEEWVTHSLCIPGDDWEYNDTHHWKTCTIDGSPIPETIEAHVYGDWVITKAPTLTQEGSQERVCSVCGYTQVSILPKLVAYPIQEGADSTWTKGSDGLSFIVDADYSLFSGVEVNGNLLDEEDYTVEPGSTIVTLKADYLASLPAGTYSLTILFADGFVDTSFGIAQAEVSPTPLSSPSPSPTAANTDGSISPKTGHASSLWLWVAVLAILAGSSIVILRLKKSSKS